MRDDRSDSAPNGHLKKFRYYGSDCCNSVPSLSVLYSTRFGFVKGFAGAFLSAALFIGGGICYNKGNTAQLKLRRFAEISCPDFVAISR